MAMSIIPTPKVTEPAQQASSADSHLAAVQNKVAGWLDKHPAVVVGTGVVLGVALGWLVKRRK